MSVGRLHAESREFRKWKRHCPRRFYCGHACNAEKPIKTAEDLRFLEYMKTDRAATYGSHYTCKFLASRVERRQKRWRLEDLRRE